MYEACFWQIFASKKDLLFNLYLFSSVSPSLLPLSFPQPAGCYPSFSPSPLTPPLRSPPPSLTSLPLIYHASLSVKLTCNAEKKWDDSGGKKKLNAFNKWLTSNRPAFQTLPIHSPMKGEKSFTGRDKAE